MFFTYHSQPIIEYTGFSRHAAKAQGIVKAPYAKALGSRAPFGEVVGITTELNEKAGVEGAQA